MIWKLGFNLPDLGLGVLFQYFFMNMNFQGMVFQALVSICVSGMKVTAAVF